MAKLTLGSGLVIIVIAALLPIGTLSVAQALSDLEHNRRLIENELAASALALAGQERDPFITADSVTYVLSKNRDIQDVGAECSKTLSASLAAHVALVNLSRLDANGVTRCSALPFPSNVSAASLPWWNTGKASPKFSISDVVIGQVSKKRVMIGMQPLIDSSGKFDGAVIASINVDWLQRSIDESKNSTSAVAAVVDAKGKTILAGRHRALPAFNVTKVNGAILESKATDGTSWMYASAPLYDRYLYIVYAERSDALMATALTQVRISLILPIITILLTSIAIWFGTNRLVIRWLEQLRQLTSQFTAGNFQGDLDRYAASPEEIAMLSNDLHQMANSIETRGRELQSALDAKTKLTREVHHRVKNNLQIVMSLLNLQASKISDTAAREALDQTRARMGGLALIHRLLYDNNVDSEQGRVGIARLMTELCAQLRNSYIGRPNITFECAASDDAVPMDDAVPLTLFAIEAVTNSYRHAFPDGRSGKIVMEFEITNNFANLCISDDGIGFDSDVKNKTMGSELMEAFVIQLGGKLSIASNKKDSGTIVHLTYELPLVAIEGDATT